MFPRPDTRPVRIDDLNLLLAMVKRRKVSPIKYIIHHWLEVFTLTGDVDRISLVTRIAQNLGLLNNALVSYIDEERLYIDFDYFCQTQLLNVAPGFKNKTRYTPYVSPGSQISHIATNKGNINGQCSIYNILSIKNITLDSKHRKDNSNLRVKTPIHRDN